MSLLEQYKIELLMETVIDFKRHRIQKDIHVFCDMCEMHQNRELQSQY